MTIHGMADNDERLAQLASALADPTCDDDAREAIEDAIIERLAGARAVA